MNDLAKYVAGLDGSMDDKLFFVDKLPGDVTVFADFGCAGGATLRHARQMRRAKGYEFFGLGYDHSPDMVEIARHASGTDCTFTGSFAMFAARLERHHRLGRKSCLVLSSVVHEVLTQLGTAEFPQFWRLLRKLGCDYIAIRDMAVEASALRRSPDVRITEAAYRDPDIAHFLAFGSREPGTFSSQAELLEGLLKAGYRDNWQQEYAERYFPLTSEQWLNWTTIASGYRLRHFEHGPLPHLQALWRRKHGVTVSDPTHIKMLLIKEA